MKNVRVSQTSRASVSSHAKMPSSVQHPLLPGFRQRRNRIRDWQVCTRGGTRTHTERYLKPPPLPIGLPWHADAPQKKRSALVNEWGKDEGVNLHIYYSLETVDFSQIYESNPARSERILFSLQISSYTIRFFCAADSVFQ